MVIYRGILDDKRIIFFGKNSKVSDVCQVICSCLELVKPYNIIRIIYPYIHILDDSVMKEKTYIAGTTNPIYQEMKNK